MRAALNSGPMTPGRGRAHGHLPPVLADRHLLEPIEVAQHVVPLGPQPRQGRLVSTQLPIEDAFVACVALSGATLNPDYATINRRSLGV
jgi:hypothetical protein